MQLQADAPNQAGVEEGAHLEQYCRMQEHLQGCDEWLEKLQEEQRAQLQESADDHFREVRLLHHQLGSISFSQIALFSPFILKVTILVSTANMQVTILVSTACLQHCQRTK